MIDLSNLPIRKNITKKSKRVGRGIGSGKGVRCGYGNKGSKARSGRGKAIGFEGGQTPFYRRVPKFRGFKALNPDKTATVTLQMIEKYFEVGSIVDIVQLKEKGIVSVKSKRFKVVNTGELSKAVTIMGSASESAKTIIENLGGKVEEA
jgi:large subunit ribosomal protein L15